MSQVDRRHAKEACERVYGTHVTPNKLLALSIQFHADPAKALVFHYLSELASEGRAAWTLLGDGDIELKFLTGEVFILGETSIARVACATE